MYSYSEIANELLKEFPEISGRYAGELAWIQDTFQGQETKGQTICFDRCFCDHIGRLLVSGHRDNVKIKQVFVFLEDMAASEDQEVKDLLQVTVLEYLRSWYLLQRESEKFMQPETRKNPFGMKSSQNRRYIVVTLCKSEIPPPCENSEFLL